MARILIVGDSQSVAPGDVAKRRLQSLGHTVMVLSNVGRGPYDYVRTPSLWSAYTGAVTSGRPDIVMLIFGHNDTPNENLRRALRQMKSAVHPKVLLTGPPLYADQAAQVEGRAIKAINQAEYGADYFDSDPYTATSLEHQAPTATFNPNPHFTMRGAQPWGNAIADEIVRRLGSGGGVVTTDGGGGGPPAGPWIAPAALATLAVGAVAVAWFLMVRRRRLARNRRRRASRLR